MPFLKSYGLDAMEEVIGSSGDSMVLEPQNSTVMRSRVTPSTTTIIYIIILNWNGLDDTLECLHSLHNINTHSLSIRVFVIDNASEINPVVAIQKDFPETKIIRSERNLGFAMGCNVGIQWALEEQADYVLLLNNDTRVHPDFLDILVTYAQTHPEVGVAGPLICYADKPDQVWFAGAKIHLAFGYFRHQYLNQPRHRVPYTTRSTDYVTGCCMLIKSSVIQKIGPLDERFFAYFEDVDFCLRARKAGFGIVFVPNSVIWHKESASTRRTLTEGTTSPLKHYLMTRNRIVTVMKHANALQRIGFLLISNTAFAGFFLVAFAVRKRWKKMVWFMRGIVHGMEQRFEEPRL